MRDLRDVCKCAVVLTAVADACQRESRRRAASSLEPRPQSQSPISKFVGVRSASSAISVESIQFDLSILYELLINNTYNGVQRIIHV